MSRSIVPDLADYEVWFLTGSQTLYGDEVLAQVALQSQARRRRARQFARHALPYRLEAGADLTGGHPGRDARGQRRSRKVVGIITWMHTFSPAKMWIAGLSALDKPMLHLHTQANRELPWSTIDFDFMNLNQAAHGDREFGYIETRLGVTRTTVVGHSSDRAVTSRIGDWCRAAAGRLASRSDERRSLRRQHALRRRHRRRQDRGRGDLRLADQHLGRDGSGDPGRIKRPTPRSTR